MRIVGATPRLAQMSISRRHLLAGAGALFVLASCGDDSSAGSDGAGSDGSTAGGTTGNGTEPDPATTGFSIAQRYPSNTFVPGMVRLPISLADKGSLMEHGAGGARRPGVGCK